MKRIILLAASPVALALTACGGGTTGQVAVNSTPTPTPPPPTPTPSPPPVVEPVTIVPASASTPLNVTRPAAIPELSIRFDQPSGQYLVTVPTVGATDAPISDNTDEATNPSTGAQSLWGNGSPVVGKLGSSSATEAAYNFQWSALLTSWGWNTDAYTNDVYGVGLATPAGAMPVTGTASFSGIVAGTSTATNGTGWCDIAGPVEGTIGMTVDFGAGTLSGQLASNVYSFYTQTSTDLPTLDFSAAISSGSNGYAGSFTTGLAGDNSIVGLFTGPGAEETIGSFTFPFAIPSGFKQPEGTIGSAYGSFIAKR